MNMVLLVKQNGAKNSNPCVDINMPGLAYDIVKIAQ